MGCWTDSGPTLISKDGFYLCIRIPESAKHVLQQRLALAVRTVTADDVVIWVACFVLATSGVRLVASSTTLTLVVTALATAMVVPVMATEW